MKKKNIGPIEILIISIITIGLLFIVADAEAATEEPFEIIERYNGYAIVCHKETKVMYYRESGSLTVLVDAEGKPLIYED